MATLALSLAGQFAGALIGGPIGATVGRALGALAGSAIDRMLFGGEQKTPTAAHDVRLQGSSEGAAVPRLYGWSRMSGNIIWARELELLGSENAGAKGFGEPEREDEVGASFAVAFCEGTVQRMGRIWADGQLLDTQGLTLRFYRGSESQLPDGLIEATQGVAPAYRGLCYLVVEQLPLSKFGNRIPQLTVELCRVVGELEPAIRAVTVIPGASEFGYDPVPRVRIVGPGSTVGENTHVSQGRSDWSWSIDELVALCPNLTHVALVVAWFGSDLRCGSCTVGPRVEAWDRTVEGVSWSVAGLGRESVPVVSQHRGGPAYGGTPSDGAVLAAIADLKARGIRVTLYPLIMMDVPEGNGLADPHGGAMQASYPWRGRISCYPGPGRAGTPDKTGAVDVQVSNFVNAGFRQMALHYAGLAQAAGGVDAMLIGSEMRGMTTLRGAGNSFPFVTALVGLAADVRAIVGTGTKLTYAADWSEYSGYQPDGEKFFHLDPLWASPNIDAVGIDNYMPLADWRDGTGHADAALADTGLELNYLSGNVAAGEGFDWYYASDAARVAGARTPIADGAHGEPWVWRYKDIRGWWSHWHHDRPGGVRKTTPSAWVPGSKPIWLTELGCGAVDKGANQPNIFGDDKSGEGGRPYFSNGTPDPLLQRQFLRAHQRHWRNPANNPAGMVDVARIYHWTWDARPFPAFPAQSEIWADGPNHRTGHWLTGRLGAVASDELARVIAAEHGVSLIAAAAQPLVQGYVLGGVTTAREALEPLSEATGLSFRDGQHGLELGYARRSGATPLDPDALVLDDGAVLSRRRSDPAETPGRLALSYIDRERDFLAGTVTALRVGDGPLATGALPLVLDAGGARRAAEQGLLARGTERESLEFALPPSALALEPGDVVALGDEPFEITEVRDGLTRRITARGLPPPVPVSTAVDRPRAGGGAVARALPVVVSAHLPGPVEDPSRTRVVLGAYAQPWPGAVLVSDAGTGATLARLVRRSVIGETIAAFGAGPLGVWDHGNALTLRLHGGHIAGLDAEAVLAGGNRLAVETDSGEWEVIGFLAAELIGPSTYRLTQLLRGQEGTAAAMGPVAVGRRVLLLDTRIIGLPAKSQWLGGTVSLRSFAGSSDLTGKVSQLDASLAPALPLAPVHLRARRQSGGDIALDWTRCSRADGDGWGAGEAPLEHVPERYRVTLRNGASVLRSFETATPDAVYTTTQQAADFGGTPGAFTFTIAQVSPVLGPGHAAQGGFNG